MFKDYSFIIICCSAANCEILFCCSFLSRLILKIFYFPFSNSLFSKNYLSSFLSISYLFSLLSFSFLKFFLKPITSRFSAFDFSAVDKVSIDVGFSKNENSGALHLVSELMVKRQPWFCRVLLVRDRVSSALE